MLDTIKVESITVENRIEKYLSEKSPDIMNIDLEGLEMDILKSIDYNRYRAKIIICEMIPYDTKLVLNQKILDFMDSVGYIKYAFTGVNSIFLDKYLI